MGLSSFDEYQEYKVMLYELAKVKTQLDVKDRCLKDIRKILNNKHDSASIKIDLIRKKLKDIGE